MKFSKVITALVTLVMLASVVILMVPDAGATASGSVTYTPSVFSAGVQTLTVASGGTFGSGSTVYFYLSTKTSSSGIVGSYIGSYTLPGGATTLNNAHFMVTIPSSVSPGSYYILASDSSSPTSTSAQFTAPFSVEVAGISPTFSVTGTQPTTTGTITGSGWDPSSSVSLYMAGPDGTPLTYSFIASFTVSTSGSIYSTFQIPSVAMGTYSLVLLETSGTNSGITADSQMSISPYVTVSPFDIGGASGTSLTVTGYGFPSGAKISAGMIAGGVTLSTPATTASSNGYFSVSGKLSSSITSTGPQYISLTYNSSTYQQQNAFYVSVPNPTSLGFTFTSGGYVNSAFSAIVYNYPASSTVTVALGSIILGSISTDSNGYGTLKGIIPAIPSGYYIPKAYTGGLYQSSSALTISPYFEVMDPAGNLMTSSLGEYMASGSFYKVLAYGMNPLQVYSFSDSGASTGSKVISIISGMELSGTQFQPASNGTLIFTFMSVYSGVTTGTFRSITLSYSGGAVSGLGSSSFGYNTVGTISFSLSSYTILTPLSSKQLTVSGLIPYQSNVYPGLSYLYNLYLGNTELTFTTSSGTTSVVKSNSGTLTFTVPSLTNGVYNLSIVYNSQGISNALYSSPMIVSVAGTSYSSGTLSVSQDLSNVYVAGYGYYGTSVSLYYMIYTGINGPYTETLTSGAFYFSFSLPKEPGGTYAIFTKVTSGSQSYYVYSSYSIYPGLTLTPSSGGIYTTISISASGLSENTYYGIYFGNIFVGNATSDSYGSLSTSIKVPVVMPGKYSVNIVQSGNTIASSTFKVTQTSTISLSTGNFAFPGQIVQFSWLPSSAPNTPSTGIAAGSASYGPVYVTVYLNGSAYTTVQAMVGTVSGSTSLNASFIAPNSMPGSYWAISFGWYQYVNKSMQNVNGYVSYTGTDYSYLGLVSGNGALLTGITPSEVAQLMVAINNTITAQMQVPLSQLNAAVLAIQGTSATISTSFGIMEASLSAIGANITRIVNGMAYVNTSLGNIYVSLNNINSEIVNVNGNIVEIKTSLGYMNTTLQSLVPQIKQIVNGVMTIQTVAGEINYNLTSFSNLQISSLNGNTIKILASLNGMSVNLTSDLRAINGTVKSTASSVNSLVGSTATIQTDLGTISGQIVSVQNGIATIQTSLGKLNVTASQIQVTGTASANTLSNTYYFDIIIIVILIVTLAFSVLAYINSRKPPRMPKEWRKE